MPRIATWHSPIYPLTLAFCFQLSIVSVSCVFFLFRENSPSKFMEKERETSPATGSQTMTSSKALDSFPQDLLSNDENHNLEADFRSMYDSIFPPKSPVLPPASEQHRLNRARLILEYQQLCDHYDVCYSRLQALSRELETLRQENSDLRLANTELLKLLNSSFHRLNDEISSSGFSPKSVMEPGRFENENNTETVVERDTLPKSISVRSTGYLKGNPTRAKTGPSRQRAVSSLILDLFPSVFSFPFDVAVASFYISVAVSNN